MNNETYNNPFSDQGLPMSTRSQAIIRQGVAPAPRRRFLRTLIAGALVLTMIPLALTGCNSSTASTGNGSTGNVATQTASYSEGIPTIDLSAYDLEYTNRDCNPSYDESSATKITLSGTTAAASSDSGVTVSGSTVTITKEGVYVVSGTLSNGQIVVNCNETDKAKVQIVLKDANISCSGGSAIYVQEAKKVFLTLADGTTNTVSDGSSYTLNQDEGSANAAIYSKDDLTIQGSGSLVVKGNYKHGIHSKDDLVITGGKIDVTSVEDAIRGKDCVKIKDGTFTITSGEDGVKSSNADEDGRGYVAIDGGTFSISAGDDGIHAEKLLLVNNGTIDISKSYEGLEGQVIQINGGTTHLVSSDDGLNAATGGTADSQANDQADKGANHKFGAWDQSGQAQSTDGSGNAPTPPSGTDAASQGSGQGGTGTMQTPPSGDGSAQTPPTGGNGAMQTPPTDGNGSAQTPPTGTDGANGQGGGFNRGGGGGMMDSDSNCIIQINGGTLVVNAGGDGVDSNGYLQVTGGVVLVSGPTSSGDGALDYGLSAEISGGTVIAVGSQGMAESFTGGTQPFAITSASGSAGNSIAVTDSNGNVLASMTAAKDFQSVVVSAPGMTEGGTYNLVVGGTVSGANADGYASSGKVTGGTSTSFTASTTATNGGFGGGFGGGGFQGGRGDQSGQGGRGGQAASGSTSTSAAGGKSGQTA